jgi:hypothetical protein
MTKKTVRRNGFRLEVRMLRFGSAQPRATAWSLVVARKASKEDELRFEVLQIIEGKRVDLRGLAE